jgi:hypothetical protein
MKIRGFTGGIRGRFDREANMVAHYLARQAFDFKSSCIWIDECPDFLLGAVARDVSILIHQ